MSKSVEQIMTDMDKGIFGNMIDRTRMCMDKLGPGKDNVVCETAYLSANKDFTYHTHPNGTPFPSDIDRNTTHKLKKRFLIIGLVPNREIVVFENKDDFTRLISRFKV